MGNIAFYGGSFNPPTNIHLQIAKNVLKQLNIDKVYFVPVGNYYQKNELIDAAAIENLKANRKELLRKTYTYEQMIQGNSVVLETIVVERI